MYEETKVEVAPESVKYFATQPWPFEHSIVFGMLARTERRIPDDRRRVPPEDIDRQELKEARWFDKREVREMLEIAADPEKLDPRELKEPKQEQEKEKEKEKEEEVARLAPPLSMGFHLAKHFAFSNSAWEK